MGVLSGVIEMNPWSVNSHGDQKTPALSMNVYLNSVVDAQAEWFIPLT
jgi:hypothetical protein